MVAEIHQGDWRNVPGAVRASLGIHNTSQDIVTLIEAVSWIARQQWQGVYHQDRSTGEFIPQDFKFDFSTLPNFDDRSSDRSVPALLPQGLLVALVGAVLLIPIVVLALQKMQLPFSRFSIAAPRTRVDAGKMLGLDRN
jgi:hypothetical protein